MTTGPNCLRELGETEILAAANWYNDNPQKRTDEQDDLIHFEPREYDDEYASSTYSEYTIRATTLMLIYYEIQLNEKEENDDYIVIADPDNGLDEMVDEYYNELKRLYQKADPTERYPQIDRIRQFINRLKQELRELVEMEYPITIQQALKKAKVAEAAYYRGAHLSLYLLKRSYLSQKSSTNEEIGELKKAILEMVQTQNEDYQNLIYCALIAEELTRAIKATSCKSESAEKVELVDPSNNILDQPIPDVVLSALTLNSRIETPDVLSIEIMYCKATEKKYPLEVVESLPIVISKVEIPIDVKVMKAKDYTIIVGTDWLGKVKGKIDLARGVLEYEWKNEKY
ncbi:14895_t:CDS:2 [Gigaspora margarita]|uniref:14895_t:CDS:1 n=1 Tax=Gigaspora margarita TaxID=4874 RepID=A0ABN7VBN4_GIGMA|nr:14895_t:CDS:2 [Gigaspora margarita]